MAKAKDKPATNVATVAQGLMAALAQSTASRAGYTFGDHAQHTWGIQIPHLALQWFVGGSNVWPAQRTICIDGEAASLKSTLMVEIGTLHALAGGFFLYIDNERKTSASMLEAMQHWRLNDETRAALCQYIPCDTAEQWQQAVIASLSYSKQYFSLPKGSRIPFFICVDSLTAVDTEEQLKTLEKEGHAQARSYPVAIMQITNFLKQLDPSGTTASLGFVRHLKVKTEHQGYGDNMRATGGSQVQFMTSLAIRASATAPKSCAKHPGAVDPTIPCEIRTVFLKTAKTCLGPGNRSLSVDVISQFVPDPSDPDGLEGKQVLKFDWHGALGKLLSDMKYDQKNKLYESDRERLDKALYFVAGAKANTVKCETLGLDGASLTEFGAAIEDSAEACERIRKFLNIKKYPTLQEADFG